MPYNASLHDALRLCELETVLSLRARAAKPMLRPGNAAFRRDDALQQLARRTPYDDIDTTQGEAERSRYRSL